MLIHKLVKAEFQLEESVDQLKTKGNQYCGQLHHKNPISNCKLFNNKQIKVTKITLPDSIQT